VGRHQRSCRRGLNAARPSPSISRHGRSRPAS
jgi:hypothetical protein